MKLFEILPEVNSKEIRIFKSGKLICTGKIINDELYNESVKRIYRGKNRIDIDLEVEK